MDEEYFNDIVDQIRQSEEELEKRTTMAVWDAVNAKCWDDEQLRLICWQLGLNAEDFK